jgi:DNA polymerase-4
LSEKTASALRHEGTTAGCIKLTLKDEGFKSWSHQQILSSKITTAYEILNLSKMLLDRSWDKITPLRLLGITLSDLLPAPSQLSLFLDQPEISFPLPIERRKILEESVDKIREKFGFWTIKPASILILE